MRAWIVSFEYNFGKIKFSFHEYLARYLKIFLTKKVYRNKQGKMMKINKDNQNLW